MCPQRHQTLDRLVFFPSQPLRKLITLFGSFELPVGVVQRKIATVVCSRQSKSNRQYAPYERETYGNIWFKAGLRGSNSAYQPQTPRSLFLYFLSLHPLRSRLHRG